MYGLMESIKSTLYFLWCIWYITKNKVHRKKNYNHRKQPDELTELSDIKITVYMQ
jgi:hypothetical protein